MPKFEKMIQQQLYDYLENVSINQIQQSYKEIQNIVNQKYEVFQNKYHFGKNFDSFNKDISNAIKNSLNVTENVSENTELFNKKDVSIDKLNANSKRLFVDYAKNSFFGYIIFEQGNGSLNGLDYVEFFNDANELITTGIVAKCGIKIPPYADIQMDEIKSIFNSGLENVFDDVIENKGNYFKNTNKKISSLNAQEKTQKVKDCFDRILNADSQKQDVYSYLNGVKQDYKTIKQINATYNKLFQLKDYNKNKKILLESKNHIINCVNNKDVKLSSISFEGLTSIDFDKKSNYYKKLNFDFSMDMKDFQLPNGNVTLQEKNSNFEKEQSYRKPIKIDEKEITGIQENVEKVSNSINKDLTITNNK